MPADGYVRLPNEHLLEIYQDDGVFFFNDNEVRMGLKDVALISRLRLYSSFLKQASIEDPSLRIDFSL